MGFQTNIADKIIGAEAHYILVVKENQAELSQNIQDEFRFSKPLQSHVTEEGGHGRIETRNCSIITDFKFIETDNKWKNLTTIIKVQKHS